MNAAYEQFLASKTITASLRGVPNIDPLPSHLFDFQRHCVEFGLNAGSFGLLIRDLAKRRANWNGARRLSGIPMVRL